MATYSKPQLERLWVQAGGDPRRAPLMAAIALAESGGRSGIVNSIGATGLWQIHPGGSQYQNPLVNARTAVEKLHSQGLGAWEAYTNGSYKRFLGGGGSSGAPLALPAASPIRQTAPGPDLASLRGNVLSSLIAASQQTGHGNSPDYTPLFASLSALRRGGSVAGAAPSSSSGAAPTAAKISGHPSLSFLEPFARRYGLSITSTTKGNHVPGSYHYQGRAVDFSGNPAHEAALQRYALNHPGQFVEAFYTGPGAAPYYVKNGRVYPIAQLDPSVRAHHQDHIHLAR